LTAAAAGQDINPFGRDRVICCLDPEGSRSGGAGKRRDRLENFAADVAETGAGGHDQYSLLLVFLVRFVLGGLIPLPTIPR
jgi:hypothetical protein